MSHHLDRPIASERSYEIAQFRREHPELVAQERDSTQQKLHAVVMRPSVFDAYIADRPTITDSYQGELTYVPTWHVHRKR